MQSINTRPWGRRDPSPLAQALAVALIAAALIALPPLIGAALVGGVALGITMFHAAGDFNYRAHWQEGVKKVEEIDHFLPRVGMRSRFLLDNGQQLIYTSSYAYQQDRIEFSETDEKRTSTTYFLMEKDGDNRTRLSHSYYLRKDPVSNFLFRLTKKKKIEAAYQQSLINLDKVVTEIPSFAYEVEDLRKN